MIFRKNSANYPFSRREEEIASLLAQGLSEKEIADKLCIATSTVNHHTANIREKNGLSKNSEIILLYVAHLNKKPFSLKKIREMGVGIILVMLNVCDFTGTGSLLSLH